MGEKVSNYPPAQLERIEKSFCADTIGKLRHISGKGKPKDNKELKERINEFFSFCEAEQIRPGIETLSLALGVSRMTLHNWSRQIGCDAERSEIINSARQAIIAFVEVAGMSGHLNPATWIFTMKNIANWSDQISIETVTNQQTTITAQTLEEIERRRLQSPKEMPTMPMFEQEGEKYENV